METEHEWNEKIMLMIKNIQQHHPELLKFLDEIPMTIPKENNPQINVKILKEYYESLEKLEQTV